MTNYHLKFWSKASGRTSNPLISALEIGRIYVNADDGSSLGYIERRTTAGERGSDSYYDQHRISHGDTAETTADKVTITMPREALDKIVEAAKAHSPAHQTALSTSDDLHLFLALKSFTRGIDWLANAKQRKELKKLANTFSVEL